MKWIHGDPGTTGPVDCAPLKEQLESLRGTQFPLVFYNNNDIRAASQLKKISKEDFGRLEGAVTELNAACKKLKLAEPLLDLLVEKKKDDLLDFFNDVVEGWPERRLSAVYEVFEGLKSTCRRGKGEVLSQMDILLMGYLCEVTKKDMRWIAKSGLALLNAHQAERNIESDASSSQ